MTPFILVVEDEDALSTLLQYNLDKEGYDVVVAADGEEALTLVSELLPDIIILDWMLPKISGIEVCRRLRQRSESRNVPIIMLTARGEESDRIRGLDAGADDYIVKPYDLDELLARVRALLRRADGRAEPAYEWGEVRIVPSTREVTLRGQPVQLSAREWAVLEPLLARPGRVLSRQQLEDKLYAWRDEVSSNAVEVYIHGVRKKLGAGLIENVRGLGYLVPVAPPESGS